MSYSTSAQVSANNARMRGDRRRYLPVLLLRFGADVVGAGGVDVRQSYRVIGVPTLKVAEQAKDILIEEGWSENDVPSQFKGASFSLSPPAGGCGSAGPKSINPRDGEELDGESKPSPGVPGHIENRSDGSFETTPNLKALAVLKAVDERRHNGAISRSGKTQDYINEARSGGMYGYGDSFNG